MQTNLWHIKRLQQPPQSSHMYCCITWGQSAEGASITNRVACITPQACQVKLRLSRLQNTCICGDMAWLPYESTCRGGPASCRLTVGTMQAVCCWSVNVEGFCCRHLCSIDGVKQRCQAGIEP